MIKRTPFPMPLLLLVSVWACSPDEPLALVSESDVLEREREVLVRTLALSRRIDVGPRQLDIRARTTRLDPTEDWLWYGASIEAERAATP